ncbi:hypothetical protein P5E67_05035 [Vibrio parahaemolyticus]|nr:hypothetical protein [Vibrio parahaemolyticus]
MTEDKFYEIEDIFREYITIGLDIDVVADAFEEDRDEFKAFVNSDPYAKKIYLKCKSEFQIQLQKGRMEAIKKGNTTALKMYEEPKAPPTVTVKFIRGDMRTPDEIEITNSEGAEKKSLESLRCWEDSLNL